MSSIEGAAADHSAAHIAPAEAVVTDPPSSELVNSPAASERPPNRLQSDLLVRARSHAVTLTLVGIVLLAAGFRFYNIEWDKNHILHPDERFVISTAVAIDWPSSVGEYFDSARSSLNPYNLENGSYIYGTFPLFAQKLFADLLGRGGYDSFAFPARVLSGLFDLSTVFLIFLIGRRLFDQRIGLLAAFLLACAVLPIQLSHFGTSDTFMSALCVATFYFSLRAGDRGSWRGYILAGACAGLAVASKLSAAPVILLLLLPLAEHVREHGLSSLLTRREGNRLRPVLGAALALLAAVWAFRIAQPYTFEGPSLWDFGFDERWLQNVRGQQEISSGRGQVPYTVQWADRTPVLFLADQMVRWGLGLPLGITAVMALVAGGISLAVRRTWPSVWHIALVGWPAFTLVYYGVGFMKYLRYALPAYPFLALLAAALLITLWDHGAAPAGRVRSLAVRTPAIVVPTLTLLYALAFMSIYTRPITRIAASEWMYENLPPGSVVTSEEWDDALPLNLPGYEPTFEVISTAPYHDETPEKIDTLVSKLEQADYVILSSNRVYSSVPRIPEQYPIAIRYYELLFSGELGFDQIATFTSRPELLGIELNDDDAEESFTVYDHPKVQIFVKTDRFDPSFIRSELTTALQRVPVPVRVGPLGTGYNFLLLGDEERAAQQAGGTWSDIFDRDSLANRHPVRTWYLALQLLALAAFPLCWRLLRGLPDRGYAVAKTVGLLLTGYVAWLLPSVHVMTFGRAAAIVGILVTGALSLAALARHGRAFVADVRARWREILIAEVLFLAAFFVFVWFRSVNPDLWHPGRGGEKPMEFAYFNAVIRSSHFPPYDPWFAGGYINYYYLGYAIIGSVVHLTGIVPSVAFNLAVPTLFALLVINTWSFCANALRFAVRRWRRERPLPALLFGLLGPLFVVILGNLDLARRVGLGELGYGDEMREAVLGLGSVGAMIRGVWRMMTDYRPLATDAYWPSTRVIPDTVNEFPYFTFLFADFHPHMSGLVVGSAALLVALGILGARRWPLPGDEPTSPSTLFASWIDVRSAISSIRTPVTAERAGLVALAAFVTGTLYPLNAWDFPTYLLMVIGGFALLELLSGTDEGERPLWLLSFPALRRVAILSAATVIVGRVLYWPFFAHYQQPNTGFVAWEESTTLPGDYLTIHAIPLFFMMSYVLAELARMTLGRRVTLVDPARWAWRSAPQADGTRAIGVSFVVADHRVAINAAVLGGLALSAGTALAFNGQSLPVLLLGFGVPLAALAVLRRHDPITLVLVGMSGMGLALSFAVERYALRGDIGRFNTVFKFYLQVWVLLGLTAAICLALVLANHRNAVAPLSRLSWSIVGALFLLAGLVYPVFATPARLDDRFNELPRNLDGLAYMHYARYVDNPNDSGNLVEYSLGEDKAAIDWLLDNVQGSPVVLEAYTPLYRWGSRISVNTGLPTVIGWDWHQTQQRPGYGPLIDVRKADVNRIYGDVVPFAEIRNLLDRYNIRYIYVGQLERAFHGDAGLAKFDEAVLAGDLTIVYQAGSVTIYEYTGPGVG